MDTTRLNQIRTFPSLARALDQLLAPPDNLVDWLQRQEPPQAGRGRQFAAQFLLHLWGAASTFNLTGALGAWDDAHREAFTRFVDGSEGKGGKAASTSPTILETVRRFPSLRAALDECPLRGSLATWLREQEREAEAANDPARAFAAAFVLHVWHMGPRVDITLAWTQWDQEHRDAAVELLSAVCPALAPAPAAAE
jgi:hypothetical protein